MKILNYNLSVLAIAAGLFMTSCSDDDDNGGNNGIETPTTYSFTRDGKSTVSYSGQTTRLAMASELASALKNPSKSEIELSGMFSNTGNYFSDQTLNTSGKNLRGKIAASIDFFNGMDLESSAIRKIFDNYISSQVSEVFPNWNSVASAGTAGSIQQGKGTTTRYVNSQGLEYDQAWAKGIIGGLITDQIINNYISSNKLDPTQNDNDNEVILDNKNYTAMEHYWDEGYGYVYGAESNSEEPSYENDKFLFKYINSVDSDKDFAGIADEIFNAFIKGREAIVNKNYEVRNQQAEIIREAISKVIAVRAVYYLQAGKNTIETDKTSAFHSLSEGVGFIYSLQFTRKSGTDSPYFDADDVSTFINEKLKLGDNMPGFWELDTTFVDEISEEIASAFGFTVAEAAN